VRELVETMNTSSTPSAGAKENKMASSGVIKELRTNVQYQKGVPDEEDKNGR